MHIKNIFWLIIVVFSFACSENKTQMQKEIDVESFVLKWNSAKLNNANIMHHYYKDGFLHNGKAINLQELRNQFHISFDTSVFSQSIVLPIEKQMKDSVMIIKGTKKVVYDGISSGVSFQIKCTKEKGEWLIVEELDGIYNKEWINDRAIKLHQLCFQQVVNFVEGLELYQQISLKSEKQIRKNGGELTIGVEMNTDGTILASILESYEDRTVTMERVLINEESREVFLYDIVSDSYLKMDISLEDWVICSDYL